MRTSIMIILDDINVCHHTCTHIHVIYMYINDGHDDYNYNY